MNVKRQERGGKIFLGAKCAGTGGKNREQAPAALCFSVKYYNKCSFYRTCSLKSERDQEFILDVLGNLL